MEKNWGFPSARRGLQAVAMRLPVLLLLLSLNIAAFAQDANVLNKRVSYHAQGQPLLKVLTDIRELTKVRFTYNADMIRKQSAVTVDVKAATLNEVLKLVLANTGLDFQVDLGGGVTIFPHEVSKAEEKRIMQIISGQVVTQNGSPLSGATVRTLGSKQGTVTLPDGMFSVLANENDVVQVSLVGMKTVTQSVRGQTGKLVVIRMDTASQAISEVVVNGYQKIDARMSTASVFKLSAAEVITPGVTSVDQMLQGKVPGLMVMNSSGSVNAKPTIRMRGVSTFVGNASPLWVIDNIVRQDPVDISTTQLNTAISDMQTGNFSLIAGGIGSINPYDIESITFLRDAAATAIYGVRAANGVIVVTTKKGKAGPMQVSYSTDLSFQQRPSYNNLHLMNSKQRVALSREMQEDGTIFSVAYGGFQENISYEGLTGALYAHQLDMAAYQAAVQKLETNNTDWFKVLFRNSFNMNHSISMSGGAGKTTYYGSLSYTDNHGAAQLDGLKRYTAKLSLHNETSNRFTIDFDLSGTYSESQGYFQNISPYAYAWQTNRAISADAVYPVSYSGITSIPVPPALTYNIQNEIANTENNAHTTSLIAGLLMTYKVTKGLKLTSTSSVQLDDANQMSAAYEKSYYISNLRQYNIDFKPTAAQLALSNLPYGGMSTISNQHTVTYDLRNDLTYSKNLFANRDLVTLTAGNDINSSKLSGLSSVDPGYFPDRGQQYMPNDKSMLLYSRRTLTDMVTNILSFYGNGVYSIANRYVFTATIRTDGSNSFGQYSNARFLPNYGLSGKWAIGEEKWLASSRFLSGLVLRASYGTQGNVVKAVGPELIASYAAGGVENVGTGVPYLGIKSLAYPDLRWEKTKQWNFGLDMSFFDTRLNVNVDYYLKNSTDLLTQKPVPLEYGVSQMYVNAGNARNTGLDLVLNITAIRRKDLNLSFRFVNGWVKNSITQTDTRSDYLSYLNGTAFIPGKPRSAFYSLSYKGLDHNTGLPLFNKLDKQLTTDPADFLVYSGQIYPKVNGSVSSNLRYRNFTLTCDFSYWLGSHKRLNPLIKRTATSIGTPNPFSNVNAGLENRWRKPGDEANTNIPVVQDMLPFSTSVVFPLVADAQTAASKTVTMPIYTAYDQSDLRVVNNSFVRCRDIQLNYMVPFAAARKMGAKSIRAGLFVNNVFTLTNKALQGQDPETDGVGTTALPVTRQYGLSLGFNF